MSEPSSQRKRVSGFSLPYGEGHVYVYVATEHAEGSWEDLHAGAAFYHHAHAGCGGWADAVVVTQNKAVLFCRNCGMRIDLTGKDGKSPVTIKDVGTCLAFAISSVRDLAERATEELTP